LQEALLQAQAVVVVVVVLVELVRLLLPQIKMLPVAPE
jgi:hypothetical protein